MDNLTPKPWLGGLAMSKAVATNLVLHFLIANAQGEVIKTSARTAEKGASGHV